MEYAAFSNHDKALQHRAQHGGWVFASEGDDHCFIWFSLAFTPSKIFNHRATKGLSGQLG